MTPSQLALDTGMQRARLRMHAGNLVLSLAAGLLVLVWLALLVRDSVPWQHWVPWAGAVLAAMGLRAAFWQAHRQGPGLPDPGAIPPPARGTEDPQAARWLLRHRMALAAQGLAWGLGGLWLSPQLSAELLHVWLFGLAALCAASLFLSTLDLPAGLLFAVPGLAPPLLNLLARGEPGAWLMGSTLLLFVLISAASAWRLHGWVKQVVEQGLQQQDQAAEAQRQAQTAEAARQSLAEQQHQVTQLIRSTPLGYWSIDADGRTLDVNDAMCTLLDRPREQVLGRHVLEFFEGEDIDLLQHELRARAHGESGGYEIGLRRPDGSRRHCLNQASPIYDRQGRRAGSMGLWTDLSARRQAERDLLTYKLVANSITDLVSVLGEDHIYRLVNNAWCQAIGLPRERVIGRRVEEVLPEAADELRSRALQECIELRQVRSVRACTRIASLAGRMLETTYYPYVDESLGVRCVVLVSRDVSAETRATQGLQAAEGELRALLEAFPGYIGAIDQQLRYTYLNTRLQPLLGRPAQALIGRSVREVLPPPLLQTIEDELARAAKGESVVSRREYRHPETGKPLILEITHVAGPVREDGQRNFYGFGLDVTARVQAETALLQARDQAEAASRAKSAFLSHMSHELRTPLNAILGFGQLLQSDPGQALSQQQQAWVQEILQGASHLLDLINEVLDLGRIEAGQLRIEPASVALFGLLEECLTLLQPLAAQRGVQLRCTADSLLKLRADRKRLKQVLLNLLSNAIQYNHEGGEVELCCHAEGDGALITVRDTGPGLDTAQQAQLFRPFVRLHARDSGVAGTGIGLALSRQLVLAMAGSIGVDSMPGQGSRFWVRLPLAEPASDLRSTPHGPQQVSDPSARSVPTPAAASSTGAAPVGGAPHTVLYIEDNPVNLSLMEAMLARMHEVHLVTASMPLPGLELARELRPELVLLDIQLPGIDGFEVLRRLRADAATRDIPVIAVSANALESDIEAALAAGFDGYLTKPLRLDLLVDTVRAALRPPASASAPA